MNKDNRQKLFLFAGLILTILIIFLPVIFTQFYHKLTGAATAVNGTMNITTEFQQGNKIYLDGQWEFYWKQLLVTEKEPQGQPDLLLKVPDQWSKYRIDGSDLPASGYGSYRLLITGLTCMDPINVEIPDFGGAYRIFIDGSLTAESGTLSKDLRGIFTNPMVKIYPVKLNAAATHEIIIEVASSRFAGLYKTPVLSEYQQTIQDKSSKMLARFFLFGIAVFSFVRLLVSYAAMVRRKFYSLSIPIFLFFILLRIILTSEFYGFWQPLLFFNLPYESSNVLMYFTTFVMKFILIYLVQEQCGIDITKREKRGFIVLYSMLFFIYLLSPTRIYDNYLSLIIPALTYILDIFLFVKIYRGRSELKKFGMIIFWSVVLISIGLSYDSYYLNGAIYMDMSLALLICLSVFLIIISWIYTLRVRDLNLDYEQSSLQLNIANSLIDMQKHHYAVLNEQMTEVRAIKHDFRHAIGVLSRLTNERKFDELKVFLNEYSHNTDMEELPVFCENIIANSIIGYYYLLAKEHGITFECQCRIDSHNTITDSDLCVILGNALENAVDACRKMQNSDNPSISFSMDTKNKQYLVKVRNTYRGMIKTSDGRPSSLKEEKSHGLGLQNIEKVVASYGGFIKIAYSELEFTFMAVIPEKAI